MSDFEEFCRFVEIRYLNDDVFLSGRDFLKLGYDHQQKIIESVKAENIRLTEQLQNINDSCQKCGTTEFLCGCNRRE